MVVKLDERITDLEEKLKQLRTRQQRILATKRALLSKRERAANTAARSWLGRSCSASWNRINWIRNCFAGGSIGR